ncbi:MAG: hypothetical protein IT159_12030 [Bryobacterales bacterium]|nr:hypothetical protein [Bryobacterales bacterium]
MDLYRAIRELYAEKKRLEEAIASLEELVASKPGDAALKLEALWGKARRGRKSMPPAERRKVSQRMKNYWAQKQGRSSKPQGKSRGAGVSPS